MSRIRFLLDENTPHAVGDQLRRHDPTIDVLAIGLPTAPAIGTPDPAILLWLEEHSYVPVTRNRRSMPGHLNDHIAAGHSVPGIIMIRPRVSFGEVIADLLLISESAQADEFTDQIVYVPL